MFTLLQVKGIISNYPDKTLMDILPFKVTVDELKGLIKEGQVNIVSSPPQTHKSVALNLKAICALRKRKSVIGLMGINSNHALNGLYYKITSSPPSPQLSRYVGLMYLLGLGDTVKTFLLGSGRDELTPFLESCKDSKPCVLLTLSNLTQLRKINEEIAKRKINKKDIVLIIDEVHSIFELDKLNTMAEENEKCKQISRELEKLIWTKDKEGRMQLAVYSLVLFTATDGEIPKLLQVANVKKFNRITADPKRLKDMGYFGLSNFRVLTQVEHTFRMMDLKEENRYGRDMRCRFKGLPDEVFLRNVTLDDFHEEVRNWLP
jgi:hypothetical protein